MSRRELWLIYGASGYTGQRIAERAVAMGLNPVLAGRRESGLRELAQRLQLPFEVFELNDVQAVATVLSRYSTVLHCAGPFLQTYEVMIRACLAAGTHYLDITGEVEVYEGLARLDEQARRAGIVVMPAVGFDMVPGDCLALQLQARLPDASHLDIGYSFDGTITRGSIRSALGSFSPDSLVRRDDQLERLAAPLARRFDFGPLSSEGVSECYATSFGDISIGWRTTRIPNLVAYLHLTPAFQSLANLSGEADIQKLPVGPSDEELRTRQAFIVGEVRNAAGQSRRARLTTPQVYAITFPLAAEIAQRVHAGLDVCGFVTPAAVFGKDFILGFDGCSLEWLPDTEA